MFGALLFCQKDVNVTPGSKHTQYSKQDYKLPGVLVHQVNAYNSELKSDG